MSIPRDVLKLLEALESQELSISNNTDDDNSAICQFIESKGRWDPYDPYEWEQRHSGKYCFIVEDCGEDSEN